MHKILSGLLAAALLFGLVPQVEAASTYQIDARVDKEVNSYCGRCQAE